MAASGPRRHGRSKCEAIARKRSPSGAAAASFAAFHLLDRAATGSWPFEKAHALLTLDSASDAEIQLPETEAGGANRGGATSLGH